MRIAVWHHEACRVMTNGDPTRVIDSFSCSPLFLFIYLFIYFFLKLTEVSELAKMQFHMMALLDVLVKIIFLSKGKISDILIRCARI